MICSLLYFLINILSGTWSLMLISVQLIDANKLHFLIGMFVFITFSFVCFCYASVQVTPSMPRCSDQDFYHFCFIMYICLAITRMLAAESLYILCLTSKEWKRIKIGKLISFTILLENLVFVDFGQLTFKMGVSWIQNLTGCNWLYLSKLHTLIFICVLLPFLCVILARMHRLFWTCLNLYQISFCAAC